MSLATISSLRALLGRWAPLTGPDIDLYIRRLREAGHLPGGRGGRNGVNSARIDTPHAISLLLAVASGAAPKEAAVLVDSLVGYRHGLTRAYERYPNGIEKSGASCDFAEVRGMSFGAFLARMVDDLRRHGVVTFQPSGLVVGDLAGYPGAAVQIVSTRPVEEGGAIIAYDFMYTAKPDAIAVEQTDILNQRLARVVRIGGNLLIELATLLGPIAAIGGGGPFKSIAELRGDISPVVEGRDRVRLVALKGSSHDARI